VRAAQRPGPPRRSLDSRQIEIVRTLIADLRGELVEAPGQAAYVAVTDPDP